MASHTGQHECDVRAYGPAGPARKVVSLVKPRFRGVFNADIVTASCAGPDRKRPGHQRKAGKGYRAPPPQIRDAE